MKGEEFNPGQPLRKEDLDHLRDSLSEAIRERSADRVTQGVFDASQHAGESIPFEITPGTTSLTIHVGSGTALAGHDSVTSKPEAIDATDGSKHGGERIVIPASDITLIAANTYKNNPGAGPGTGTGTGPFHESADGLGGFTATPESTKTRDVPVTGGVKNWVWLGYLKTVRFGPSDTTLHKITSEILYPFAEDGYKIEVTTTASPPTPDMILLGTVELTGLPAGPVTAGLISTAGRALARLRVKHVSVRLDSTLKPTSVVDPSTITLEEFVNAVGSGTRTPSNILGLTLADLGFTEDIDLLNHRRQHHTNGLIVPDETSTTSALFPATSTSTPIGGDSGAVFIRQLGIGSETLLMNGTVFTEVTPKLTSALGGFPTGTAYVSFGTVDAAGIYGILVKQVGNTAVIEKRISPFSFNVTAEYLVAKVEWSGSAFINPAPPGVQTNDRKFGSVSNKDIHVDAVETDNIKNNAVTTAKILDSNVTTAKIADLNVTTGKLAGTSVTEAKLDSNSVSTVKIQDDAVTTSKILDGDVRTVNLQDDSVTSPKLKEWDTAAGQDTNSGAGVKTDHIADEAVTTGKLSLSVQASIASASVPTGTILSFAGVEAKVPAGWLLCDGQLLDSVSDTTLNPLFQVIGTTWGGTGASSFRTPDLRGSFLRGVNTTAGEGSASDVYSDPNEGSRTNRHTGGVTSGVASYQTDRVGPHTHAIPANATRDGSGADPVTQGGTTSEPVQSAIPTEETRPRNAYVLYIIKK